MEVWDCLQKKNMPCFTFCCFYNGTLRNGVELEEIDFTILRKKLVYVYSLPYDTGSNSLVLDPTSDITGDILPEYIINQDTMSESEIEKNLERFGGMYINEPGMNQYPNCSFANFSDNDVQIWTIREIKQGEELLIYYGSGFDRPYLLSQYLYDVSNLSLYFKNGCSIPSIEIAGISIELSLIKEKPICELVDELDKHAKKIIIPLLEYLKSK